MTKLPSQHIESIEFAVNFTVISGFGIFRQALEEDKTLGKLATYIKRDRAGKDSVLRRIHELANEPTDPELEHPADLALAAYLFVLNKVDRILAYQTAEELLRLPNLWWAQRLARTIVASMSTASITQTLPTKPEGLKLLSTAPIQSTNFTVVRLPRSTPGMLWRRSILEARAS